MAENQNELAFYLNQARALAGQDRFDEAREAITNAYKFATGAEMPQVEETERQIEEQRGRRVQKLSDALTALLEVPADRLTSEQAQRGEETLARLVLIHPDPAEVDRLRQRWRDHRRRAEAARVLQETQRKLQELWQSHYTLLSRYDEAVALARQVAAEHPDDPAFQELRQKAEQKREEVYRQSGELITQAATAGFRHLIIEVQGLYDRGEPELPWYEWGLIEVKGQNVRAPVFNRTVPASQEAITHLVEMAREYEEGKAEEYRQRAQAALPADPERAAEEVAPILPDDVKVPPEVLARNSAEEWARLRERFTYVSPEKRRQIAAFYTEKIAPALQRRARARALLAEAMKPGQDPEAGWGLAAQAASTDPYLGNEVAAARELLRPYLRVKWEKDLQKAEDARRAGRFEEALPVAERICAQAEGDEGLRELYERGERLRRDCQDDRELLAYVQAEAQRIAELVEQRPEQAQRAFDDLEARVAGRPLRYQQPLQKPRAALQARLSLEQKLADWERRLRQTDPTGLGDDVFRDQTALQQRLQSLEQILEEMGRERDEPRLAALKQRVIARQYSLQGRAAWVAGLYDRALNHWQKAKGGDDDALVIRWLAEAEDATRVADALDAAAGLRKVKEYRKALEILAPWLPPKPSPRQEEVIRRYNEIRKEYAQALVAQIEELLHNPRPLYRQLVDLINTLAEVDAQKADAYKADRFPKIYEEWGDQKCQGSKYSSALEDYDIALRHARGEDHARIAGKRRRVRKQIAFHQVEARERNRQWPEAQSVLEALLQEYPDDAETLWRLAKVALAQDDVRRATGYLGSVERRLEEAHQQGRPDLAGLERQDQVDEWRLRLRALSEQAQASEAIAGFMEEAKARLQSARSIREYRLAREGKDNLIKQLRESEEALSAEMNSKSAEFEGHPAARSDWNKLRRWLRDQAQNQVPRQYNRLEGELIQTLEQALAQTTPPDVETLPFRAAPPDANIQRRWQVGLKVHYLSDGHRAAGVYQELLRALSRLRVEVSQFKGDPRGPAEDLEGQPLEPLRALELQILWAENIQAWAAAIRDILDAYGWAAGDGEARNEASALHDEIEAFQGALLRLQQCVRTTHTRLARAIAAGKDSRQHWGLVIWREVVSQILLALPEKRDDDWTGLEHTDPDARWQRWQAAAAALQRARLSERPEQAPWQKINKPIHDAGLDERWEGILEPLAEVRQEFGQHRVVEAALQAKDEAERLRNRLVLMAAGLYAWVQAEGFQEALGLMEQMEALDREDRYGFRARLAIPDFLEGKRRAWPELRQHLEAQQRQWEELLAWWAPVESSALKPWQERHRAEVIALASRAEYDKARELCRDARDGRLPGGRTNRLGGGLALKPLVEHLQDLPDPLQPPLSHRVERKMQEVAQWHHDAADAVRELDLWLAPG